MEQDAVAHATRLAAQLFLLPENVLYICTYWLSQYSSYSHAGNEKECFNELVEGLLTRAPRLYLCANQGLPQQLYNRLRCQAVIQFAGTETHRMPLEYLASGQMPLLFESLAFLLRPEVGAFLTRNTDGLDGELELSTFVHDSVLETVAEPSFLVITAYMLHLHALVATTCSAGPLDWAPRHIFSLRAINEESRASLRGRDEAKLARTRSDLERLYEVLNTTDFATASRQIFLLWEGKASFCWSQIMARSEKLNPSPSSSASSLPPQTF